MKLFLLFLVVFAGLFAGLYVLRPSDRALAWKWAKRLSLPLAAGLVVVAVVISLSLAFSVKFF